MEYYRYGKFCPSDYVGSWVAIVILLMFSIAGIVFSLPVLYVVFSTIYAAIWLWAILAPNHERFKVCDDYIIAITGGGTNEIRIPSELTLIVSYADICPPFAQRTAVGNRTHILKDKIAITILHKMPLDVVLERLHRNYMQKYTTSTIRIGFEEYRYIYSFVCDRTLIDKIIEGRDCVIIIPESLSEKLSVDSNVVGVHLDMGY